MKPHRQRLALVLCALAAVAGASVLALSALREQASFYYTPGDLAGKRVPTGRAVRLGGMVVRESVEHLRDGVSIRFRVTDGRAVVPVTFTGVPPDLFREGSGVVAEGRFRPDGGFVADNLLAKHDERYMPPGMDTMSASPVPMEARR